MWCESLRYPVDGRWFFLNISRHVFLQGLFPPYFTSHSKQELPNVLTIVQNMPSLYTLQCALVNIADLSSFPSIWRHGTFRWPENTWTVGQYIEGDLIDNQSYSSSTCYGILNPTVYPKSNMALNRTDSPRMHGLWILSGLSKCRWTPNSRVYRLNIKRCNKYDWIYLSVRISIWFMRLAFSSFRNLSVFSMEKQSIHCTCAATLWGSIHGRLMGYCLFII